MSMTALAVLNVPVFARSIGQHVIRFDIDMFKCCYCDFCTTVCPTFCLYMTPEYENGVFSREHGLYHFSKYAPDEAIALMRRDAENDMQKALAKEAAMAAKKAAVKEKPVREKKATSTEE
jgi:formate hydrogenlyase subunit 6/NADH:ubiquinone oxidoreductase subunit I